MNWLQRIVGSTIGKKAVVGITGLGLVGFLVAHLAGNLNLYRGDEAMNAYAEGLHGLGGLLIAAEVGLALVFVLHISFTIKLIVDNRRARGGGYGAKGVNTKRTELAETLASRMMGLSGIVVLAFLIVHISDFRLEREEIEAAEGLAAAVHGKLGEPWRMALYTVGSLLVGWHVFHGIQSAFRSLGYNHSKFTPILRKGGMGLAVLLGLGFASLPLWIFFGN